MIEYEISASGTRIRAVTISREYGSGGGEVASRLARRLGWDFTDHAIVECTARALGIDLHEAQAHDEFAEGIIFQILEAIRNLDPTRMAMTGALAGAFRYHKTVDQIVRATAARGRAVIVGRASQVILADRRDVLHVRIVAPFAQRIAYVMQHEGLGRRAAEARIQEKDHEQASYLRREYHHRDNEAQLYDLVLNTSRLDVERAVDIICFSLHEVATGPIGLR